MCFRKILTSVMIVGCLVACVEAQDAAELGNAAFEEGRYAEAVTHYQQALNDKLTFAVYVNLGHACMKLERWTDAAASYRAAIELDPASVTADVRLFLAQAYYQEKKYEAALEAFLEAASSSSDHRTDVWIARCLIEFEQWLRAKSVLLAHLGANPKDLESLELLAYVCGQMDDQPGVIDAYRELLTAAPDRTSYRVALANALALGGRNQQAIDTLELAWRLDNGTAEKVNRLLADLYLAEQMPHEAALCYARAIRTEGHPSADDYFRLGTAYLQSGEFASAREALDKMQQIDPADYRSDLNLGHIAMAENRPEEAERHFKTALAKASTCSQALLALAQLEMEQRRYEQAATHFAAAIEAGDERPQVYRNHLLALLHMPEKGERTKTAIKAALARHPSNVPLQQLLDRYLRRTDPAQEDK